MKHYSRYASDGGWGDGRDVGAPGMWMCIGTENGTGTSTGTDIGTGSRSAEDCGKGMTLRRCWGIAGVHDYGDGGGGYDDVERRPNNLVGVDDVGNGVWCSYRSVHVGRVCRAQTESFVLWSQFADRFRVRYSRDLHNKTK